MVDLFFADTFGIAPPAGDSILTFAMNWITATQTGVMLAVHACPRAAQDAVQGLHGDAVKIRLRSPPVDGKANDALIAFLSRTLAVPARDLFIVSGQSSRRKRVAIAGLTETTVRAKLGL